MRNFDQTIKLIMCEFEHWLKMCDIAEENDYDTGYFGARAIICDNIIEKYRNGKFNTIDDITEFLDEDLKQHKGCKQEFLDDNKIDSEKIQGFIEEEIFLLQMIKQGPI